MTYKMGEHTHIIDDEFLFVLCDAENEEKLNGVPMLIAKADKFFKY